MNYATSSSSSSSPSNLPSSLSYEDHYRLCTILPASSTKIIIAAPARLYQAPFSAPDAWSFSGLRGIVVFGYDAPSSRRGRTPAVAPTNYWFRLVDLRRGKVNWMHEVHGIIEYESEKPFFHVFGGQACMFGFRFDEDEDAAVFLQEVTQRVVEIPVYKSSKSPSSAASSSTAVSRSAHPPKAPRSKIDRAAISAPVPDSFEHVAHLGEGDAGWNVAPEWTKLLKKLEGYGVDAEMVEENLEFVKGFLAGAEAMRTTSAHSTPRAPPRSCASSRTSSTESLDKYAYDQETNGYYSRSRRQHSVPRKPIPAMYRN